MVQAARILVVDDVSANLRFLSAILEQRGYSVRAVDSGAVALCAVRDEPPDLILLDIEMPEMDGFAVCEQLRLCESLQGTPVIFISAHTEPADIVMAFGSGGVDYITKPFQVDELNARIETHLKLRRLQLQLEEANRRLASANLRMSRDLHAAAMIQQSFVPHEKPKNSAVDFAWIYRPCDELGGDGLNIVPFADGRFGLYVLDVSGHGIASALLSVAISRILLSGSEALHTVSLNGCRTPNANCRPPAEVAARLNQLFPFDAVTHQFTTIIYGGLDPETGEFQYICAGHPGPVHLPSGGHPVIIENSGFPIGLATVDYEEHSLVLGVKDRLYLYSDAVQETSNVSGEQFGKERLLDAVARHRFRPLQESVDSLLTEIIEWRGPGERLRDDVSILAVEFLGTDRHANCDSRAASVV